MANLPENTGAILDPTSKNYISFTTFKGLGMTNDDLLSSEFYP